MTDGPLMLTATAAAKLLGLQRRRITDMHRAGILTGTRLDDRHNAPLMVTRASIERFLEDPPATIPTAGSRTGLPR